MEEMAGLRDADYETRDFEEAAKNAHNGVCSICEEALYPLDPKWAGTWTEKYTAEAAARHVGPVCPDLPYHVRCLEEPRY